MFYIDCIVHVLKITFNLDKKGLFEKVIKMRLNQIFYYFLKYSFIIRLKIYIKQLKKICVFGIHALILHLF